MANITITGNLITLTGGTEAAKVKCELVVPDGTTPVVSGTGLAVNPIVTSAAATSFSFSLVRPATLLPAYAYLHRFAFYNHLNQITSTAYYDLSALASASSTDLSTLVPVIPANTQAIPNVELQTNKDVASGYAGLDSSALLKLSEMPIIPDAKISGMNFSKLLSGTNVGGAFLIGGTLAQTASGKVFANQLEDNHAAPVTTLSYNSGDYLFNSSIVGAGVSVRQTGDAHSRVSFRNDGTINFGDGVLASLPVTLSMTADPNSSYAWGFVSTNNTFSSPVLASDPNVSGWGSTQGGRFWFNSTTPALKYFDGVGIQTLGTGMAFSGSPVSGFSIPVATSPTTAQWQYSNGRPLNVRDFGAKGDGVTDDTAAIQAAFNAVTAQRNIVFIPQPTSGFYKTTAAITDNPNGLLQGVMGEAAGVNPGCLIKNTTGSQVFLLTNISALGFVFANLRWQGPGRGVASADGALLCNTQGQTQNPITSVGAADGVGHTTYNVSSTTGIKAGNQAYITGCTNAANNGLFQVSSFVASTSVTVFNNGGVVESPVSATIENAANIGEAWFYNLQATGWGGVNAFALHVGSPIVCFFNNLRLLSGSNGLFFNGGTSCTVTGAYMLVMDKVGYDATNSSYNLWLGCAADNCGVSYRIRGGSNAQQWQTCGHEAGSAFNLTITGVSSASGATTVTYSGVDQSACFVSSMPVAVNLTTNTAYNGRFYVSSMSANTITFTTGAADIALTADTGTISPWPGDGNQILGATSIIGSNLKGQAPLNTTGLSCHFVTVNSVNSGYRDCFTSLGSTGTTQAFDFDIKQGNTNATLWNNNTVSGSNGTGNNLIQHANLTLGAFTPATVSANVAGKSTTWSCNVWNGSVSKSPSFSVQTVSGTGSNPTVDLQYTFSNGGSSSNPQIQYIMGSNATSGWNVQYINNTVATASFNFSPASPQFVGSYWTGTASANDGWIMNAALGTGANPTSSLQFSHYQGSTGARFLTLDSGATFGWGSVDPLLVTTLPDTGLSRISADVLAFGNGTQSDVSATIKAAIADMGTGFRIAGAAATGNVLRGNGTNFVSAQLAFSDLSGVATAGQIPSLDASKITTGQLALARGGTNADLSATGGTRQFLKQSSVGAAITVGQPALADLSDSATIALLASPALTGTPTAPTASAFDNSTKLATTGYIDGILKGDGEIFFKEDWLSASTNAAITTATAFWGDTSTWTVAQIVGGTQSIAPAAATFANPGQILFTTSAVSGQGLYMSKYTAGSLGNLAAQGGWEMNFRFKLGQTTTCCVRFGLFKGNQNANDPPTDGIYVEYDTANTGNTDTKFTWVTRSGSTPTYNVTNAIAVDTGFHKFRIRSTVAGTILFSVDNGTETAVSTNVTTAIEQPCVQLVTRTTAASTMTMDSWNFIAATGRI